MTEREMLLMAYGALKAVCIDPNHPAIKMIEDYLWPKALSGREEGGG